MIMGDFFDSLKMVMMNFCTCMYLLCTFSSSFLSVSSERQLQSLFCHLLPPTGEGEASPFSATEPAGEEWDPGLPWSPTGGLPSPRRGHPERTPSGKGPFSKRPAEDNNKQ